MILLWIFVVVGVVWLAAYAVEIRAWHPTFSTQCSVIMSRGSCSDIGYDERDFIGLIGPAVYIISPLGNEPRRRGQTCSQSRAGLREVISPDDRLLSRDWQPRTCGHCCEEGSKGHTIRDTETSRMLFCGTRDGQRNETRNLITALSVLSLGIVFADMTSPSKPGGCRSGNNWFALVAGGGVSESLRGPINVRLYLQHGQCHCAVDGFPDWPCM